MSVTDRSAATTWLGFSLTAFLGNGVAFFRVGTGGLAAAMWANVRVAMVGVSAGSCGPGFGSGLCGGVGGGVGGCVGARGMSRWGIGVVSSHMV